VPVSLGKSQPFAIYTKKSIGTRKLYNIIKIINFRVWHRFYQNPDKFTFNKDYFNIKNSFAKF